MTMLEKMARAIQQGAHGRRILPTWELMEEFERGRWMEAARAALGAMRDPPDNAIDVMVGQSNHGTLDSLGARDALNGLIDAILDGK